MAGLWDMLQFTLNGVVFLLLGEHLPGVFAQAQHIVVETGARSAWRLIVYALSIVLVLTILRYCWVWIAFKLTLFRARRRGEPIASSPPGRIIAAMFVAGARGAITLAGALTLPLALSDGSPFPACDLVIFLTSNVILNVVRCSRWRGGAKWVPSLRTSSVANSISPPNG